MQKQDICCIKCGKFILTEQKDDLGRIRCIAGSYENGFYDEFQDEFFCLECAKKEGYEV